MSQYDKIDFYTPKGLTGDYFAEHVEREEIDRNDVDRVAMSEGFEEKKFGVFMEDTPEQRKIVDKLCQKLDNLFK